MDDSDGDSEGLDVCVSDGELVSDGDGDAVSKVTQRVSDKEQESNGRQVSKRRCYGCKTKAKDSD